VVTAGRDLKAGFLLPRQPISAAAVKLGRALGKLSDNRYRESRDEREQTPLSGFRRSRKANDARKIDAADGLIGVHRRDRSHLRFSPIGG
jgi:hypothetical protein